MVDICVVLSPLRNGTRGDQIVQFLVKTPTSVSRKQEQLLKEFAELEATHFLTVEALEPEIVLLGTGQNQHFPHPRLTSPLLNRGVGVEIMDTAAACRTYNIIMAEGRRVVAALLMIRLSV